MGESAREEDVVLGPRGWRPWARSMVKVGGGCYPQAVLRRQEQVEPEGAGPEDFELVTAMARGDAAALGSLYDRHAARMYSLAKKIVVTPSSAEDIVQEVFLEAWKKAASYDPARGGVKSWLLMRTRSRCIDFRRAAHQSRSRTVGDDFWTEQVASPVSDVSLVPDQAAVRRALAALPKDQREALLLGYFEGLSSSEIAARVGSPVGTIKTRVAAALSKLRVALSDRHEDAS
jgi:RNA polymerase sigma-70 factor, ECF subfamily